MRLLNKLKQMNISKLNFNDKEQLIKLYGERKVGKSAIIKQLANITTIPRFNTNAPYTLMSTQEELNIDWKNRYLLLEVLNDRSIAPLVSTTKTLNVRDIDDELDLIFLRISLGDLEKNDYPLDLYKRAKCINRFPLMGNEIASKHMIARHIKSMANKYGDEEFSFHPETFSLPEDHYILTQYAKDNPHSKYIMKPKYGSQGSGIHLHKSVHTINNDPDYIVQRYIDNPLLINGRKFSLRVYALITSLDPLVIYFHNSGSVKFTTSDFTNSLDNFNDENHSVHISNVSINKDTKNYVVSPMGNVDNLGSKWSFKAFMNYLDDSKICSSELLLNRIKDIIIKTVMSVESNILFKSKEYMSDQTSYFQLLGFDIDVNEKVEPILIEANNNPQLGGYAAMFDNISKLQLIRELFDIIGFTHYNSENLKSDIKKSLLETMNTIDNESIDKLVKFSFENLNRGNFELIYPTKQSIATHSKYHSNSNTKCNNLIHDYVKSN